MGELSTFIKLDRNILKWRWYQDANTMRVFIHLLLNANIEPCNFQKITIQRGELATSYSSIAFQLGLSVKNVRTAIEHLKATGEVASKQYSKFQVISIVNYSKYQDKPAGNGQADGRQTATIKEYKNIRNKEDIRKESIERKEDQPKEPKKAFGAYGWVKLTDTQHQKLISDLGQSEVDRCIQYIDESAQSNGNKNKWKDWNLVIRKCSREGWGKTNSVTKKSTAPYVPDYSKAPTDEETARLKRYLDNLGSE